MLRAVEYEILRGVRASGRIAVPLAREPVRVATIIDEQDFLESGGQMVHNRNIFLEDRLHDWDFRPGEFRYYSRVAEVADVLVVYKLEKSAGKMNFDPLTGQALQSSKGA